jgi:hypothetical protein
MLECADMHNNLTIEYSHAKDPKKKLPIWVLSSGPGRLASKYGTHVGVGALANV